MNFTMIRGVLLLCVAGFAPASFTEMYGWDFGLRKRCLREGPRTRLVDDRQCSKEGSWTLGLHSESGYRTADQCPHFPFVNTATSPVTVVWSPTARGGWRVRIATDLINHEHVCGAGYFTWSVLMDQNPTANYPPPLETRWSGRVCFSRELHQGATRAIVGWQGWWNGAARCIEVGVYLDRWGVAWGDGYAVPTDHLDFVFIDGALFGFSPLPLDEDVDLAVDWGPIIRHCIDNGYIDALPADGPSATAACYVGYELHNWAATNAGRASMEIEEFRIARSPKSAHP